MKTRISPISLLLSLSVAALLPQVGLAQEASVTVSTPPAAPPPTAVDPAKLPYGVSDVAKLAKAQVSEDVIITYVQNSGTAYNLSPTEIVYLRDQGVSDHVINVMLDQRRNLAASAPQNPPAAPPAQQPAYPDTAAAGAYAQTAPNVPSSSLYVIPYSTYPAYSYYDPYYYSYPYYGGYYGYCGPSFVFSFGHGFSHGFHGGGFHGGGFHGGGIHVGHGGSGHFGHR